MRNFERDLQMVIEDAYRTSYMKRNSEQVKTMDMVVPLERAEILSEQYFLSISSYASLKETTCLLY